MKRILIIQLFVFAIVANTFAQENQSKKESHKSSAEMPEKKNAVKLNLTSLVYKNIALQYERALTPKIAVAAQIRFMPKSTPMFYGSVENALKDGNNGNNGGTSVSNVAVGSFAFTPEFRFYPKHVLRGFYLAPYFRYRNISMGMDYTFQDTMKITRNASFSGKINSYGGGLMIGSHFNIGKSFSLDWFILGIQYMMSRGNFDLTVNGSNLSLADQNKMRNDLQTSLDDTKILKNNTVVVGPNSASVGTSFGFVGFRGFGLNFGYRF